MLDHIKSGADFYDHMFDHFQVLSLRLVRRFINELILRLFRWLHNEIILKMTPEMAWATPFGTALYLFPFRQRFDC